MANHMDIFTFCLFYLICFTALFSLTPLGSFPPRDIIFALPGISLAGVELIPPTIYDFPWVTFISVMAIGGIALIIAISLVSNVSFEILGTGVSWNFNGKYVCTILMGFIVGGGLGISMTQMMPIGMPLLVQFFLVWVWIILLVYSVIMFAGGSGE